MESGNGNSGGNSVALDGVLCLCALPHHGSRSSFVALGAPGMVREHPVVF
tara:strand:+ start:264 stop:413 length:150 start_codon:yes stop_codon:yes gene_type:complete